MLAHLTKITELSCGNTQSLDNLPKITQLKHESQSCQATCLITKLTYGSTESLGKFADDHIAPRWKNRVSATYL